MIDALISGTMFKAPTSRPGRNGGTFVTGKIRVAMAAGESCIVSFIGFRDSVVNSIMALGDGDSAALSGELKISTYTDRAGATKPALDITVHAVLTTYHVAKKRKTIAGTATAPDFDDEIPAL